MILFFGLLFSFGVDSLSAIIMIIRFCVGLIIAMIIPIKIK